VQEVNAEVSWRYEPCGVDNHVVGLVGLQRERKLAERACGPHALLAGGGALGIADIGYSVYPMSKHLQLSRKRLCYYRDWLLATEGTHHVTVLVSTWPLVMQQYWSSCMTLVPCVCLVAVCCAGRCHEGQIQGE
jgi:hypothetical protein